MAAKFSVLPELTAAAAIANLRRTHFAWQGAGRAKALISTTMLNPMFHCCPFGIFLRIPGSFDLGGSEASPRFSDSAWDSNERYSDTAVKYWLKKRLASVQRAKSPAML
jgi:hypothetical protein